MKGTAGPARCVRPQGKAILLACMPASECCLVEVPRIPKKLLRSYNPPYAPTLQAGAQCSGHSPYQGRDAHIHAAC